MPKRQQSGRCYKYLTSRVRPWLKSKRDGPILKWRPKKALSFTGRVCVPRVGMREHQRRNKQGSSGESLLSIQGLQARRGSHSDVVWWCAAERDSCSYFYSASNTVCAAHMQMQWRYLPWPCNIGSKQCFFFTQMLHDNMNNLA